MAVKQPFVLITISGGVGEHIQSGEVDVVLIDYDNLNDRDTTAQQVQDEIDVVQSIPEINPTVKRWKENALESLQDILSEKE